MLNSNKVNGVNIVNPEASDSSNENSDSGVQQSQGSVSNATN